MLFEIVTGQVLLAKRRDFLELHQTILIPTYKALNIGVVVCLISDVGNIGQFTDIYTYESYEEYDRKTMELEEKLWSVDYYTKIQSCISGSIQVSLASHLGQLL